MFEKYTYKVKFTALLVITAMLSIAAYKRSFSPLISLIKENKKLKESAANIKNSSLNIEKLASDVAALDKIIGKGSTNREQVQQEIINFASTNYSASIYNVEPIHEFSDENYIIHTNQIDLTGNLNSLLSISYEFEKKLQYSKMVSFNLYTTKKNNTSDLLHLKLIFQDYENNN